MNEAVIIFVGFFVIVVLYAFFKKWLFNNREKLSVRDYQIRVIRKMIKDMDISKEELFDEE